MPITRCEWPSLVWRVRGRWLGWNSCALEATPKGCRWRSKDCWIVNVIALAYTSIGLQCPIEVKTHCIRGMASSWDWSSGVCVNDICAAAGWSSPLMFARFYNVLGLHSWILSVWGLDCGVLDTTKSVYDHHTLLIGGAYQCRFWLLLARAKISGLLPLRLNDAMLREPLSKGSVFVTRDIA